MENWELVGRSGKTKCAAQQRKHLNIQWKKKGTMMIIIIVIRIKFACYHVVMHLLKFNYSHYLLIF